MMLGDGLAPPRGAAALWKINHLAESGTENAPIDSLGFLRPLSHCSEAPHAR